MNPETLDAAEIVAITLFGLFCFLFIGLFVRFVAGEVDREREIRRWRNEAERKREESNHSLTTAQRGGVAGGNNVG